MKFEEYWEQYGDLHASSCGGNIKRFAKEIWDSAQSYDRESNEADNEKRNP
jgi:hypothetical protein